MKKIRSRDVENGKHEESLWVLLLVFANSTTSRSFPRIQHPRAGVRSGPLRKERDLVEGGMLPSTWVIPPDRTW